jgi:hypothetical protein
LTVAHPSAYDVHWSELAFHILELDEERSVMPHIDAAASSSERPFAWGNWYAHGA